MGFRRGLKRGYKTGGAGQGGGGKWSGAGAVRQGPGMRVCMDVICALRGVPWGRNVEEALLPLQPKELHIPLPLLSPCPTCSRRPAACQLGGGGAVSTGEVGLRRSLPRLDSPAVPAATGVKVG